jgi:hypothetical protein
LVLFSFCHLSLVSYLASSLSPLFALLAFALSITRILSIGMFLIAKLYTAPYTRKFA